jgi:hypothetical protein
MHLDAALAFDWKSRVAVETWRQAKDFVAEKSHADGSLMSVRL